MCNCRDVEKLEFFYILQVVEILMDNMETVSFNTTPDEYL